MFSSAETCSAPLAANCIMFDGSLEARIKSIVRGMSSPPARSGFKFFDRQFQFSNQSVGLAPNKFLQQGPVVPESSIAAAVEPRPERFSDVAVVGKNGAHIVQFVGGGNQPGLRIGCFQMPDVRFFAFPPPRVWIRI